MNYKNCIKNIIRVTGFDIVKYRSPKLLAVDGVSARSSLNDSGVAMLRERYPKPRVKEACKPLRLKADGGGRELVENEITSSNAKVMLEIGSFFGDSALRWVEYSKDLKLVCVDPWSDSLVPSGNTFAADQAIMSGFEDYVGQLNEKDGFFNTVVRNFSEFSDRIVMVRDVSPSVLSKLFLLGFKPDLIFIDATKIRDDLALSHQLWPEAILSGDDWGWAPEKGYPMRKVVTEFASQNGFQILQQQETWVLKRRMK